MKNPKIIITAVLALCLFASVLLAGCSKDTADKLIVVTSTSLLAQIVERIADDRVDVVNIIPPAQCPGHFDVKPDDIKKLSKANLFLLHGWQGEKFSQELIASANNQNLSVVKLDVQGNWMVPSVQAAGTDLIATALCQADARNCPVYQKAAAEYKSKVAEKESELKSKLAGARLSEVNVLCGEQQAGFVKWTGLNLVGTFGTPDTLAPQVVKGLVDKGKQAKVSLVIDNLQSGKDAGAAIAEELGCTRIILSNFPGGFDNTETWEKAVEHNIDLILKAVGQ